MNPLSKVALGKTSVFVTRLGLGGSPLGGLYQDISEETAIALVHRVLELGINFIDTAPLYGHGKSEQRLGLAHSIPLKAAALQFPLAHRVVAAVIPGARSVAEVEENFRMMSVPIPDGFWNELRERRLLPEAAPTP